MRRCVSCFKEIESGELRYPTWQFEGENFIHKNCLLSKVLELCQDERYENIIKFVIAYEEDHISDWAIEVSGNSADSSWDRGIIKLRPQEIRRLLDYKVIGVILPSNKHPHYALCNRKLIKEFLQRSVIVSQIGHKTSKIDESILNCVIGYNDVKKYLIQAINDDRRVHFLFEGAPATAKTIILLSIERALGDKCYYATGSRTTAAGITESLLLYEPRVLILDELEKIPQDALSVLLSVMESGDIVQTKHRSHLKVKMNTIVLGACNSSTFLPAELLSRFKPYHLHFNPYSKDEYIEVCQGYLSKFEDTPVDLAKYIGERTWQEFSADIREARGIARMLVEKTKEEVDRQITFLRKYRKGG